LHGIYPVESHGVTTSDLGLHRKLYKKAMTRKEFQRLHKKGEASRRHVGSSNYSDFSIQPWDIWEEYDLNPWAADIIKRVLRTKKIDGMTEEESRIEDYEKIIHICQYRIEKLKEKK